MNLEEIRKNLLDALSATEDAVGVSAVVESVLYFGLRQQRPQHPGMDRLWQFLVLRARKMEETLLASTIRYISTRKDIHTPKGKARAWIRHALNLSLLVPLLHALREDEQLVQRFYDTNAVITSLEDWNMLLDLLGKKRTFKLLDIIGNEIDGVYGGRYGVNSSVRVRAVSAPLLRSSRDSVEDIIKRLGISEASIEFAIEQKQDVETERERMHSEDSQVYVNDEEEDEFHFRPVEDVDDSFESSEEMALGSPKPFVEEKNLSFVDDYFKTSPYRTSQGDRILDSGQCVQMTVKPMILGPLPEMLKRQNNRCWDCKKMISIGYIYSDFRSCFYTGKLYCFRCHSNQMFVIPAFLVQDLDCNSYPVCNAAIKYLKAIYRIPTLSLSLFPGEFLSSRTELLQLRHQRRRIVLCDKYLSCCKHLDIIHQSLDTRAYLLEDHDLFSLYDLRSSLCSDGIQTISDIATFLERHITSDCTICSSRGSICPLCNSTDRIFLFQVNFISQCRDCESVFHRICFERLSCPFCCAQEAV